MSEMQEEASNQREGQPPAAPLTGYPSIDKPWMKYYDEAVASSAIPEGSIWDTVVADNRDYPHEVALLYFGRKITYRALFRQVHYVMKSFAAMGVRAGDNVALCMPAMPEAIYSILALNALGANAVLLNPTFDTQQMHRVMIKSGAQVLVTASETFGAVAEALAETLVSTVVECSAMNSMNPVIRAIKSCRKGTSSLSWKEFIRRGTNVRVGEEAGLSDAPAITVFSSGTTGDSKGIQLSNKSVNAMILQYRIAGFNMKWQDRYFAQVPIWFSTGIVVTMLVPLALGITVILEPLYDFKLFRSHIHRYEPDYLITATGLLEFLMSERCASKAYGGFKYLAIGGEYLAPSAEKRINEWLATNESAEGVHKGYGMCECGGAVTSTNSSVNVPGSSGIPLPHVTVAAFDASSNRELPYGERGELRVQTPCAMMGYLGDREATEAYFWVDADGNRWACTGDIGYVAEDGSVYVDGRISDSYVNAAGDAVYLFDIERAILDAGCVRQCKAIACEVDDAATHVCHLALAPGADQRAAMEEIRLLCADRLPGSHFPRWIRFYEESLPVAPSGKLDTVQMRTNADGLLELSSVADAFPAQNPMRKEQR